MKTGITQKIINILFSIKTMILLFVLLALGAAVATFIENDYGTSTARVLVYNHIWYELVMLLTIINLMGIIYKRKMWHQKAKFIFHFSFVLMLIGASMTRYIGFEGIMHIREGESQNQIISLEPYMQITITKDDMKVYAEFQKEFVAIGDNSFYYEIPFGDDNIVVTLDNYRFAKQGKASMNLIETKLIYKSQEEKVKLVGERGSKGVTREATFKDGTKVLISYGSKDLTIPFFIKLRDFQLDRYPGSMSPSSYASEVSVIDRLNSKEFDYRIFMNSTLTYGGYKFFQSSYDQDERGTILSVNKDPGVIPTYLGYFLLTLGLVLNMFDKKSRFAKLSYNIKNGLGVFIVGLFLSLNPSTSFASEAKNSVDYLTFYKDNSHQVADSFSKIVVQSMGRMKPNDTLNYEIVSKLTGKSTFLGMNHNQIILGMMSRPNIWQSVKMLKIKTPKLKQTLGIEPTRKYVAFNELFDGNNYKLLHYVKEANAMDAKNRGTFEKDVLKLDEKLNIAYMVYHGKFLTIFPNPTRKEDTKWYNPMDAIKHFDSSYSKDIAYLAKNLINNTSNGNYQKAIDVLDQIFLFQKEFGQNIFPNESIIEKEILFNKLGIFPKLTLAYVLIGFVLFIVSFLSIFFKNLQNNTLNKTFLIILLVLFTIQTFGMGIRWYISGHAPWSDTYESLVYIAWSAMFAGIFFFRNSLMALSATVVMAGVFMFTAHLSGIDPQITNLVPVLKSYWLTIHVSIITGSYGFLAIGAMLGFMGLILFIFRNPTRPQVDFQIKQITQINEMALIIGVAMLVVGNFIGGVWANESWGRYWGWDPKETWAWVSIVVYSIVLHLRLIPKFNTPYIFNVASTLAFSSILMTYFGVNFYLSGMHSYATGDPVPIPLWVYVLSSIILVVIFLASLKKNLEKIKIK